MYSRLKDTLVPTQLQRSKCRKDLSRLCGEVIKDVVLQRIQEDATLDLEELHQALSRGVLQILAETYLGTKFDDATIMNATCLEIFRDADKNLGIKRTRSLSSFVQENRDKIAPEDLGGISELLSGHSLKLKSDIVTFENNPQRRGAGRIYTPYDVTEHMCKESIIEMMKGMSSPQEVVSMRILDPAVGSGAFLAQAYRSILNQSLLQGIALDDNHKSLLISDVLHGVDVDPFATKVCKLVMFLESRGKYPDISPSIFTADSLVMGGSPSVLDYIKHVRFNGVCEGYDLVIGNPPYVRIKPEDFEGFLLADTRNLYGLFCELSISLTKPSGIFSMIIPQAVMGARETQSLRNHVLSLNAEVKFQVFDSVPDFLFDQGKIESNTNTNINQRTVIVSVSKGKSKKIFTSKLLRWRRREERDVLFNHIDLIEILPSDIHCDRIPMISNTRTLELLRAMKGIKQTIGDVKDGNDSKLYMTKAVRYFITALPRDLGRPNTLQFGVEESHFERVHALLNSNVFYWWWRVFGNGFQVEQRDVDSFPLLDLNPEAAKRFSRALIDLEEDCLVFKRNAGKDIPNVNYNFAQGLVGEIDDEIFKTLHMENLAEVFISKTNSLHNKMDALVGYGGQNED
jgi:hypothetical protein